MAKSKKVARPSAFELADMAGCASPDSPDSIGARFLIDTWDAVIESATWYANENDTDLAGEDIDAHEIADGAVPTYTHERWRVFVELAAYREDGEEVGGFPADLTAAAGVALYQIAFRLAVAVAEVIDGTPR